MEKGKTIFEQLDEKNICYSVLVSLVSSKLVSVEGGKKEYSIIIHRNDLDKLKGYGFYNSEVYKYIIYERDLLIHEVARFKESIENFVKVKHDKHGRVYELKNNSFKSMYESLKHNKWN